MNLTLRQIKVRQMYQAINVKSNPPTVSLGYLYKYVIDLVISEPFPNVLTEILKLPLDNPFPTIGINKIEDKYAEELAEGNLISANFDSYGASIAGLISRIIKGRISGYLQEAREILQTSFFELHTTYKSFKEDLEEFNDIYKEFMIFEKAKMLGLVYISLIDQRSFNIRSEEQ
ncbi:YxiJ family protein [Priestia megaterium]|uniref:YxiJ family protein n=1 Tax=Priestia megaterium TaxID=1404 RepID=UPI002E23FF2B|nr:YxiJ family protein [Priestia megaterium]